MVNTIWSGFDYLTYYLSTTVSLFLFVSRGDILIAKTDPPLLSVPLSLLARIKGAKFVNWLQDLYPEVALKLGFGTESGIMPKFLMHLRNRSLWRAHLNIAIGNRMAEYLKSLRVPSDRIQVVHNFADDLMISRSNEHSLELREQWGINESDFVVGYSGNLGRAHDLTTILDAAEMLSDIEEIKFVFIGGGFGHKQLLREIKARKLLNVSVKPYQARSRLNESLALPNLHWASLLPELEGFIVPSKIYGIGLSYAGHINETASEFDPAADPPVFQKAVNSIAYTEANVTIPSSTALLQVADQFEAGLGKQLEKTHPNLPALMDYEVELGFVLLEDITPEEVLQDNYIPRLGFFVANDLSARSLAILGEGQTKRYDYWGISKSFPGFTPVGQQVWIPNEFQANAIPCVQLQTLVNGEVRQDQRTSDLIYTPLQMLQAIQRRYPDTPLRKGDWV